MKSKILFLLKMLIATFFLFSCNSDDNEPEIDLNTPINFELIDFFPKQGVKGTEITIEGNNFGIDSKDVKILLNDIPANITEISNKKIKVLAPINNRGVNASLSVSIKSEKKTFDQSFLYPVHAVDEFNPKISVLSKDITIKGSFFSSNPNDIKVSINDRTFPVLSSTLNTIIFQTNLQGVDLLMNDFPISVEIDGNSVESSENFTFGAQFKINDDLVNNNHKNKEPLSPGSAININIDINAFSDNKSFVPIDGFTFFIGDQEAPLLATWPPGNGSRDFLIDIPTNLELGSNNISIKYNDKNLIPKETNTIEIGRGLFRILGKPQNFSGVEIEMTHIFRQPKDMIIKLTNTLDNSVIDGRIQFSSFSDDFTKTNIKVEIDTPGIYKISVFTSDGIYELEPAGSDLFEFSF